MRFWKQKSYENEIILEFIRIRWRNLKALQKKNK